MLRRRTNQESIVYAALEFLNHATVEELISYLKENDFQISLATIYRNINKLSDEGKIRQVKIGELEVYETTKAKHYHYICRCCNNIIDLEPNLVPVKIGKLDNIYGNQIDDCDLVLYGICHSCKLKQENNIS